MREFTSKKQHNALSQIKLGAGLSLFGLLCPFFWTSLIFGGSGFETWVYGFHSAFFILLGLFFLIRGWIDLKHLKVSKIE
jgi:hypothetical protein